MRLPWDQRRPSPPATAMPLHRRIMQGHGAYDSVNGDFADRTAISNPRAGRVEQRRDASQNQAALSGRFLNFAGSTAKASDHAARMDSGRPGPSARCYGVTILPSPPPASPLGEPLPSETSTTSMSKMSLRPASGWLASMVTESSPRAVMRTGTVWPFSRRS